MHWRDLDDGLKTLKIQYLSSLDRAQIHFQGIELFPFLIDFTRAHCDMDFTKLFAPRGAKAKTVSIMRSNFSNGFS